MPYGSDSYDPDAFQAPDYFAVDEMLTDDERQTAERIRPSSRSGRRG